MAYRLQRDESIPMGVRRIAHETVDHAIALLDDPGDDVDIAVHDVRKDCKMLRGLVRLVRPGLGPAYRDANVAFRDASRHLAPLRDAHALLATFDDLIVAMADHTPADAFAAVRAGLDERSAAASAAISDGDQRLAAAKELLIDAGRHIDEWPLTSDVEVLAGGIAKTYRRGRHRLRDSMFKPTDEALHQWRKRVKYTWYHVRLLRDSAPSVLKPLSGRLHDLSDVLGDDHDLAVLTAQIESDPASYGGPEAVGPTGTAIELVRADLQQRAWRLGARLYVESARAFSKRLADYWVTWQEHGDEWSAGEISDLSAPADDLDERSVRQLYALARELDVPGRSSMDRDELIVALRAAGWTES